MHFVIHKVKQKQYTCKLAFALVLYPGYFGSKSNLDFNKSAHLLLIYRENLRFSLHTRHFVKISLCFCNALHWSDK